MRTIDDNGFGGMLARVSRGIPSGDIDRYQREFAAFSKARHELGFEGFFPDWVKANCGEPHFNLLELHRRMLKENQAIESRKGRGGFGI